MLSSSVYKQVHLGECLPQLTRISSLRPDPAIQVL